MPLRDGSMRLSTSLRLLFSPSERCSSERAITTTKTIIPFRSVRAITRSALPCGNPTRPSERPKNGWSRNPNPQGLRIRLVDQDRLRQLSQHGEGSNTHAGVVSLQQLRAGLSSVLLLPLFGFLARVAPPHRSQRTCT